MAREPDGVRAYTVGKDRLIYSCARCHAEAPVDPEKGVQVCEKCGSAAIVVEVIE